MMSQFIQIYLQPIIIISENTKIAQYNMHKLLDQALPQYYAFLNKAHKKLEQNTQSIDLFVVLDISGSMNSTCNKTVNSGAGYYGSLALGASLFTINPILAGVVMLGGVTTTAAVSMSSDTRLDEAKKHLLIQIKDLIRTNRINQLGLITFNHKAKIVCKLNNDFETILQQISDQKAAGQTALYDSIDFAAKELKNSNNPRMLIMTDGQDNASKKNLDWAKEWFMKSGLKSTFFTICEGNNQTNRNLAKKLQSKYIELGEECWFSNSFNNESMVRGMAHLS